MPFDPKQLADPKYRKSLIAGWLSAAAVTLLATVCLCCCGIGAWLTPASPPTGANSLMFKKVAPAVVLIEVLDKYGLRIGQGSGFFIDGRGTVVTNAHVALAPAAVSLRVTVFDDELKVDQIREVDSVIATDVENDVAILRLKGMSHRFIAIRETSPAIGERAFAVGNPIGLLHTMSDGLISGRRSVNGTEIIQTSAPISSGSSGGPLIDANGKVIGVTTAGISGESLNFAIPSSTIAALLKRPLKEQRISTLAAPN